MHCADPELPPRRVPAGDSLSRHRGEPQAAPGNLCIYESTDLNVQGQIIVNPVTNSAPGAARFGVNIIAQSVANGVWATIGTGAVRSP